MQNLRAALDQLLTTPKELSRTASRSWRRNPDVWNGPVPISARQVARADGAMRTNRGIAAGRCDIDAYPVRSASRRWLSMPASIPRPQTRKSRLHSG